jgi:GNAT superfamily N-acetyltransferase
MKIALLADYLQHVETLARWHCEEDGRAEDPAWLEFWRRQLRAESGRETIPLAFVALDGDAPVGGVSLVEHNMLSHPELTPWLAGTFVHPSRRGKGIGVELVRHATARARELGLRRLYLYTENGRGFYERLGWKRLSDESYEGEDVSLFALDLAAANVGAAVRASESWPPVQDRAATDRGL